MKTLFGIIILSISLLSAKKDTGDSFWNDKKYLAANTAANETYLSQDEKNIYYFLNLARMDPSKFADSYLKDPNGKPPKSGNERSLYLELKKMKAVPFLKPAKELYETAACWAKEAGTSGAIGHNRKKCKEDYWAECCAYGNSDPLAIVLQLLIDNDVPGLGHRKICLGDYSTLGVSIKPHKKWGTNAVLDFK